MSAPYSYATVAQDDAELPLYTPTSSTPLHMGSNKDQTSEASVQPNVPLTSSNGAGSSNTSVNAEATPDDRIKSLEARVGALESIVLFPSELEVSEETTRNKAQREEKETKVCLLTFFWVITVFTMLIILLNTLQGFKKDKH